MDAQQPLALPGPRISRVTIGRLHNLGDYEHVRFEITVELPPGTAPASVIGELASVLDEIDPKSPVDLYTLDRARRLLSKPEPAEPTVPHDPTADPFGDDPHDQYRRDLRERESARESISRHETWRKAREAALARFNEFGGTQRFGGGRREDDDGDQQ